MDFRLLKSGEEIQEKEILGEDGLTHLYDGLGVGLYETQFISKFNDTIREETLIKTNNTISYPSESILKYQFDSQPSDIIEGLKKGDKIKILEEDLGCYHYYYELYELEYLGDENFLISSGRDPIPINYNWPNFKEEITSILENREKDEFINEYSPIKCTALKIKNSIFMNAKGVLKWRELPIINLK